MDVVNDVMQFSESECPLIEVLHAGDSVFMSETME